MSNIYVATSWRNPYQELVVNALQGDGHEVYDFKHPTGPQSEGFSWEKVTPPGQVMMADGRIHVNDYKQMIEHDLANMGFTYDMDALDECDVCVCVLPCGNSAHLELGWAAGMSKFTAIISDSLLIPDLMYKVVDYFTNDLQHLRKWLEDPRPRANTWFDVVPA